MENLNIIAENYSENVINNNFVSLDENMKNTIKTVIKNAFLEGNKINDINNALEDSIQDDEYDPIEDALDSDGGTYYDADVDDMEDSTPMDISEYVA